MRRKALITTALAGFVGLAGLAGFAHAHGWHRSMDPAQVQKRVDAHFDHMMGELDATPQQREKLGALKDKLVADGQTFFGANREVHATFLKALTADEKPDADELHALVDQRIDALRKLAHEAVDAGVQAHDILDAKQRAKIADHVQARFGDE
jgi:Spy/CpxP family protein refolding chaperone